MKLTFTLAGAAFLSVEDKQVLRERAIGDILQLEADPTNAYDSTAVKVMYDSHHLGFVPADQNSELFAALMEGAELQAEIVSYETETKPVLELIA